MTEWRFIVALVAAFVGAPGCDGPRADGADTSHDAGADARPAPPRTEPLGSWCSVSDDRCLEGVCAPFGVLGGQGVCAKACETSADCGDGRRCTNVGEARICLLRCARAEGCPRYPLDCIDTLVEDDLVCWPGEITAGELVRRPRLSLVRVEQRGRLAPGTGGALQLVFANEGPVDFEGTFTLVSGDPRLTPAPWFNPGGDLAVPARSASTVLELPLVVGVDASVGEALALSVNVVDASGSQFWPFPVQVTPLRSGAVPLVSAALYVPYGYGGRGLELRVGNGGPVRLDDLLVEAVSLTPTITLEAGAESYPGIIDLAADAAPVAANGLRILADPSHPAGSPVEVRVTLTAPGFAREVTLTLPDPWSTPDGPLPGDD